MPSKAVSNWLLPGPEAQSMLDQFFADGLRHKQGLINKLEKEGHRFACLPGKQAETD